MLCQNVTFELRWSWGSVHNYTSGFIILWVRACPTFLQMGHSKFIRLINQHGPWCLPIYNLIIWRKKTYNRSLTIGEHWSNVVVWCGVFNVKCSYMNLNWELSRCRLKHGSWTYEDIHMLFCWCMSWSRSFMLIWTNETSLFYC